MNITDNKLLILKASLVLLILFLAFFLRIVMVNNTNYRGPIRNDAREYYSYAVNMKFNDTYSLKFPKSVTNPAYQPKPDKIRPPGYPLFLYPFVKFPANMAMVQKIQWAQVIIDTLTVLVAFGFFRLFLSYRSAIFTALLVAISPHLIAMNIYVLTETLFTFALTLYLLITARGLQTGSLVYIFFSGLLLAVTVLIKPTMNYFLFFLIGMMLFVIPKQKVLKISLVMLLGFLVTIAPWSIRNMGLNSGASTKAIDSLKNGSYPGLMYKNDPMTRAIPHRADPNYRKIKTFSEFIPNLIDKASKNPGEYLSWYILGKPLMFFSWNMVAGMGDIYIYRIRYSPYFNKQVFRMTHALMKGAHPIIVSAALIMLILVLLPAVRKYLPESTRIPLTLCAVMLLYFTLVHVAGNPLPRYAIPLRPIQLAMATFCFGFIYNRVKQHRHEAKTHRSPSKKHRHHLKKQRRRANN